MRHPLERSDQAVRSAIHRNYSGPNSWCFAHSQPLGQRSPPEDKKLTPFSSSALWRMIQEKNPLNWTAHTRHNPTSPTVIPPTNLSRVMGYQIYPLTKLDDSHKRDNRNKNRYQKVDANPEESGRKDSHVVSRHVYILNVRARISWECVKNGKITYMQVAELFGHLLFLTISTDCWQTIDGGCNEGVQRRSRWNSSFTSRTMASMTYQLIQFFSVHGISQRKLSGRSRIQKWLVNSQWTQLVGQSRPIQWFRKMSKLPEIWLDHSYFLINWRR